jgi:type I restriction enzyme M protein
MRRKIHYVIKPSYLWASVAQRARIQSIEMAEIEKNDFNLNISRYISTATADEEINLQAVSSELDSLEQAIADARDSHNSFLKELGLPPLP